MLFFGVLFFLFFPLKSKIFGVFMLFSVLLRFFPNEEIQCSPSQKRMEVVESRYHLASTMFGVLCILLLF